MNLSKDCGVCNKENCRLRCGRCKKVYYCSAEHQREHWPKHKFECGQTATVPEKTEEANEIEKPAKKERRQLDEEVVDAVAEFVECESYEECRDFLQKNPSVISQEVSDSLFEKGYLAFGSHPPAIGTRFIRNAQIINYLCEIQKVSLGQQDISLFFHRLLGEDPSFKKNFEDQVVNLVGHIQENIQKRLEKQAAEKTEAEAETSTETQQQEGPDEAI